jgi:hypothetical protein
MRLSKWIIFTVLFSLGPLLANYLVALDEQQVGWGEIIGRGELFVIAAAVTADGLGRIWTAKAVQTTEGTIIFGALIFLLFASCTEFGYVSDQLKGIREISSVHIRNSVIIYLATVTAGLCSVFMEGEQGDVG